MSLSTISTAFALAALVGLSSAPPTQEAAPPAPLTADWRLGRDQLSLRSEPWFAGAISSLKLNGAEYLNAADHGRLLQGSISFDDEGECLNPTVAGASKDGPDTTTSKLLSADVSSTGWSTSTQMAYWNGRGDKCSLPSGESSASAAKAPLSDVVYEQTLKASRRDGAIFIDDTITFVTKAVEQNAAVEAATAYLSADFTVFSALAPRKGVVATLNDPRFSERAFPVIASTPDKRQAMALLPKTRDPAIQYGGGLVVGVGKLNIVYDLKGDYAPGPHAYPCVIVIGSLQAVTRTVRKMEGLGAPKGAMKRKMG